MGTTPSDPDPPGRRADDPGLYDTIVQRLFATGLGLQAAVALVGRDPLAARARIERAIDDLDDTVRAIRAGAATAP